MYVRLAETGDILSSGDLAHFTGNWEHKRVPGANFDREQSLRTMERIGELLDANGVTVDPA